MRFRFRVEGLQGFRVYKVLGFMVLGFVYLRIGFRFRDQGFRLQFQLVIAFACYSLLICLAPPQALI